MQSAGWIFRVLTACLLTACFTEVGNPGKEQKVTADFSIDYTTGAGLPKRAAMMGPVHILHFYLNVVVITYRTVEKQNGTLWNATDSLGIPVDFTQQDSLAVLPPLQVPSIAWDQLKFKSHIPDHVPLDLDTVDFNTFAHPGYIKGTVGPDSQSVRFLFQLPNVYRLNFLYYQAQLDPMRQGDAYHLQFKFFATPWALGERIDTAATSLDQKGGPVAVIDLEHNADLYQKWATDFYHAFNDSTTQTENP